MSELSKFLEKFPPDIQESAWSEINGSHGYIDSTEGAVTVARAILAECQRCAEAARKYQEHIAGCSPNDDEPEKIYAAVMAGT